MAGVVVTAQTPLPRRSVLCRNELRHSSVGRPQLEGCFAVQVQKPPEHHIDHATMADNHDRLASPSPNELVECLPDS